MVLIDGYGPQTAALDFFFVLVGNFLIFSIGLFSLSAAQFILDF